MILVHGVYCEVALYSQPAQPPGGWLMQDLQQVSADEAWLNSPL